MPEKALTAHLKQVKSEILDRLSGRKTGPAPSLEPTGIAAIDVARQSVVAGEWKKALNQLDPKVLPAEARTKGLASLYRGIILAESGLGTSDQAIDRFREAFEQLEGGKPSDLFLTAQ